MGVGSDLVLVLVGANDVGSDLVLVLVGANDELDDLPTIKFVVSESAYSSPNATCLSSILTE